MADVRYKDLTIDNVFDFCDVLAVIGVEQVINAFDRAELNALQKSGKDVQGIGVAVAVKICGILVKNISKARNEICTFFANCMEWDTGAKVTMDEVKSFKIGQLVKMIKAFAEKEDLIDFFGQVAELAGLTKAEADDSKS